MRLTTLIIDDNERSLALLREYCDKTEIVELVNCFDDPLDAINHLNSNSVDLIFLDIEMGSISGFDLLDFNFGKTLFVITTGHAENAAKGYDYDQVVDFLLKPIAFPRFLKSVNRTLRARELKIKASPKGTTLDGPSGSLTVRTGKKNVKIIVNEIVYIRSIGNYVKIVTLQKTYIPQLKIGDMENNLPNNFLRVHKSYIVNVTMVEKLMKDQIIIGDETIPIGNTYKQIIRKHIA